MSQSEIAEALDIAREWDEYYLARSGITYTELRRRSAEVEATGGIPHAEVMKRLRSLV